MDYWQITDHACRACMGRVLVRQDTGTGRWLSRCADCGGFGEGIQRQAAITAVCACGAKQRSGKDAGHRCIQNQDIKPESPMEIMVSLLGEGK